MFKRIFIGLVLMILMLSGATKSIVKAGNNDVQIIKSNDSEPVTLVSGHYTIEADTVCSKGIVIPIGNTVYIDIPEGLTLTCYGLDAVHENDSIGFVNGGLPAEEEVIRTGKSSSSTPGITVEYGATLYLTGKGNVVAKGGDGSVAGDAVTTSSITFKYGFYGSILVSNHTLIASGFGQRGGNGANAPSPAIGGRGGEGGNTTDRSESSGHGGLGDLHKDDSKNIKEDYCVSGSGIDGDDGDNGDPMGDLYIVGSIKVTATAGTNHTYTGKGGYYAEAGIVKSDKATYKKDKSAMLISNGSTGGGGGASTPAAIIGGGGAGGGAGGSGTGGSYYYNYNGQTGGVMFTFDFYNGKDGEGINGGDGGLARCVKDPTNKYLYVETGRGGEGGVSGNGGRLFISETASVNGISGDNLKQTDLGAETKSTSGQGATVAVVTPLTINVFKDGNLESGHSVILKNTNNSNATAAEDETGVYIAQVSKENVNYYIWVDNVNTGYTINASQANSKDVNIYTSNVNITLEGVNADLGEVSLLQNNRKIKTLNRVNEGVYSAENVYINPELGENINKYQIYVDNKDSLYTIDVKPNSSTDVEYVNASVNLTLDDNVWDTTNNVVLDSEDLSLKLIKSTTTAGQYNLPISKKDTRTYDILINSKKVYRTLKVTDNIEDRAKTVPFFTAVANLKVDNEAYKTAKTTFKNSNVLYVVSNSGTGAYSTPLPIIEDNQGDEIKWEIEVFNANDSIGHSVSSNQKSVDIDFNTVKFMTTSDATDKTKFNNKLHRSYLVVTGGNVKAAPDAYLAGLTFDFWSEAEYELGELPQTPFDFSTTITSTKTLYAHFVEPEVNINSYVKCDSDATENGKGEWFKMPNLSITGYGEGGVIKTIRITTINEAITKLPARTDLTVSVDNQVKMAMGGYYDISGDNTIILSFSESVTAKDAQSYLRSIVIKPVQSKDNSISITTSSGEISGDKPAEITQTRNVSQYDPHIYDGGYYGSTTFYSGIYYIKSNTMFTGAAAQSGIVISGDVVIIVPSGVTLTAIGGNANGVYGAGAGIEVNYGSSVRIYGEGAVVATGGSAANGCEGGSASAYFGSTTSPIRSSTHSSYSGDTYDEIYIPSANSGYGGAGGGGAGAGIGTKGGAGGSGGANFGKEHVVSYLTKEGSFQTGSHGEMVTPAQTGGDGGTGDLCGTIYLSSTINSNSTITGGAAGTSGGAAGYRQNRDRVYQNHKFAAFGGGGGGGAGGAAYNIGTGGPGGGGGGAGTLGGYDETDNGGSAYAGGGGYGGYGASGGATNGSGGVHTGVQYDGGIGGSAGEVSTYTTPIIIYDYATQSYTESVKFIGSTDEINKEQTYRFYYNDNRILFPEYEAEPGKAFIGWKVSKYGGAVNTTTSTYPFTYADPTIYLPSSTLVLNQHTFGNIELEPIVEIIPPKSAVDKLKIGNNIFVPDPPKQDYFTYTVNLDVDGETKDLGPLTFVDKNDSKKIYIVDSTTPGVYSIKLTYETTFDVYNQDGTDIGVAVSQGSVATVEYKTMKVQVNLNDEGTPDLGNISLKNNTVTVNSTQTYKEFKGTGLFTASVLSEDAKDTYDIYLNGVDTKEDITPSSTKTLDYYSIAVSVKKDGTATADNTVTLRDNSGAIKYTLELNENGNYAYTLLKDTNIYKIYVDDEYVNQDASFTSTGHKPAADKEVFEVNYVTITVNVKKDKALKDMGAVVLKDAQDNKVSVRQTSEGVYQTTKLQNNTEYNVFVGGQDVKQKVKYIAESSTANVNFYNVTVKIKLDGSDKDAGLVVLKKEGYSDVVLSYDTTNQCYIGEVPTEEGYEIYIDGDNTGSSIVPKTSPTVTLKYQTISFNASGGTGAIPEDKIYKVGDKLELPQNIPTLDGKQFVGWSYNGTTYSQKADSTFDSVTIVEGKSELVATYKDNGDFESKYSIDGGITWLYGTLDYALEYAANNPDKQISITLQNNDSISKNIPSNVTIDVPNGVTLSIAEGNSINNDGVLKCDGTISGKGTLVNNNRIEGNSNNHGTITNLINTEGSTVSDVNITNLLISDSTNNLCNSGTLKDVTIGNTPAGTTVGGKIAGTINAGSGIAFDDSLIAIKDENDVLPLVNLEGGGTVGSSTDMNNTNTYAGLMNAVSDGETTRYAAKTRVNFENKLTINDQSIYANFFDFKLPDDLNCDETVKKPTLDTSRTPGLGTVSNAMYRYETGVDKITGDSIWSEWSSDEPVKPGKYQAKIDVAAGDNYNGTSNLTSNDWTYEINSNPIPIKKNSGDMSYNKSKKTFNSMIIVGHRSNITAHIKNAFVDDEVKVYIGTKQTKELSTDNYELKEGSLKIVFKPSYIAGLSVGTHKYQIKLTQYNEDFIYDVVIQVNEDYKDESCEKVIGPTWHWNNTKGVCEEYALVRTNTR